MNPNAQPAVTFPAAIAADDTGLKYPHPAKPAVSFLLHHTMTEHKPTVTAHPVHLNSLPTHPTQKQIYQEQQRAYVNALVDVTVQAIASIWPNAISAPGNGNRPIANLSTFLHHILKHSRTTHSTLQLAIFYLFRVRPRVLERCNDDVYISCGRRMFLATLICAHKFLQDKTYKNSAWSKVSGLSVAEVNHAERVMLQLLDWSLYVKKDTYDQWIRMLQSHLKVHPPLYDPKDDTDHRKTQQRMRLATHLHPTVAMAQGVAPSMATAATYPTATLPVSIHPTTNMTAATTATASSTTPKPTTTVCYGMPTPVEELNSSLHYPDIRGSVSPSERKRKRSIDIGPVSAKRRD